MLARSFEVVSRVIVPRVGAFSPLNPTPFAVHAFILLFVFVWLFCSQFPLSILKFDCLTFPSPPTIPFCYILFSPKRNPFSLTPFRWILLGFHCALADKYCESMQINANSSYVDSTDERSALVFSFTHTNDFVCAAQILCNLFPLPCFFPRHLHARQPIVCLACPCGVSKNTQNQTKKIPFRRPVIVSDVFLTSHHYLVLLLTFDLV